jgi:hypothetical protein
MDDDRTGKEHRMYTVVDVTTGEAANNGTPDGPGDPVLFDTYEEAVAWAVEVGYDDNEHRIEEVKA